MNIIDQTKSVFTNPVNSWESFKADKPTLMQLIMPNGAILAAIPAIAYFIGQSLIGTTVGAFGFSVTVRTPIVMGLIAAILQFAIYLAFPIFLGFIMSALAPNFGGKIEKDRAFQLGFLAYIPAYLGGIFYILPFLGFLASLAGVFSLVLLYLGGKKFVEIPAEKYTGFIVVSLLIAVVAFGICSLIVGIIAGVGTLVY